MHSLVRFSSVPIGQLFSILKASNLKYLEDENKVNDLLVTWCKFVKVKEDKFIYLSDYKNWKAYKDKQNELEFTYLITNQFVAMHDANVSYIDTDNDIDNDKIKGNSADYIIFDDL